MDIKTLPSMKECFDEFYKEEAFKARVQWKGTDVCLDWECECGSDWHVDAYFAYSVKCKDCGNVYALNPNIEMIRIIQEPNGQDYCEPIEGM